MNDVGLKLKMYTNQTFNNFFTLLYPIFKFIPSVGSIIVLQSFKAYAPYIKQFERNF